MQIGLKAIKGRRTMPDSARLRSELNLVLGTSLNVIEADYRLTFATWRHRPRLFRRKLRSGEFDVGVYPNTPAGKIWYYVNDGTRPHKIRARKARVLRFFKGGTAKTRRGIIPAGTGSKGTDGPIFRREVDHPGNAARNFDDAITQKNNLLVDRLINQTFDRLGL